MSAWCLGIQHQAKQSWSFKKHCQNWLWNKQFSKNILECHGSLSVFREHIQRYLGQKLNAVLASGCIRGPATSHMASLTPWCHGSDQQWNLASTGRKFYMTRMYSHSSVLLIFVIIVVMFVAILLKKNTVAAKHSLQLSIILTISGLYVLCIHML